MITKLNYNFGPLEDVMGKFCVNQSGSVLAEIKHELNKFFKDAKCKEIIFTRNTDRPFFGMCVIPYINGDLAAKILGSDDKERITQYYIELDSKLLSLGFTKREYVAMLLHEIGHVVNNAVPVEEVRKAIDFYLHSQDDHLIITKSMQYRDILAFGMKRAILNLTSMFRRKDEEMKADEFCIACGYGKDLEYALRKLMAHNTKLKAGVPPLLSLQWTLRLYKDIKFKRIPAIRAIDKMAKQTGSELEQRELKFLKNNLQRIDDSMLIEEGFTDFMKSFYDRYRYKGLKTLEDDSFELALCVKNVDETEEALALIRRINRNMALVDDYLNSDKDMPEAEKKRCFDLLARYSKLRDDISKKTTYDNKYYGLFVKMPEIKSRYEM